jgi:hypothetical protein
MKIGDTVKIKNMGESCKINGATGKIVKAIFSEDGIFWEVVFEHDVKCAEGYNSCGFAEDELELC